MPTTCVFQLDRFNPVYRSGDYIMGRILLKTDKAKRVNSVYVTLEGRAKVHWSITGKSATANYYGSQQYLYTRTNVFDNTLFCAGTHVYVLSLRIPPDCPTTCSGPYGYIAYNISMTIYKPWTFDEIFCKPIGVVQSLDLNMNPEYALPVKEESIKHLCQWPCSSGPICSTLILPCSGFAPVQQIRFLLEVDNQSPHYDIYSVEASLKQHFVFLADKPLKRNYHSKSLVKTLIEERTLRLTKRIYEGSICVPSDTPRSTLNPNYIVFLHYTLQLKLKTGQFHCDITITAPVVIGTEPLRQQADSNSTSVTTTQPTMMRSGRAMARLAEAEENGEETATNDEPPSYDSCLPPSFSFATLGSQQTLESSLNPDNPNERFNISLPRFPGYSTFAAPVQALNMSADSVLDLNHYRSYGSLDTDHTGRSLGTFRSSCGILSETDDNVLEEEDDV